MLFIGGRPLTSLGVCFFFFLKTFLNTPEPLPLTINLSSSAEPLQFTALNPSLQTNAHLTSSNSYNSLLSRFRLQRLRLRGKFKSKQPILHVCPITGTFMGTCLLPFLSSWPLCSRWCKMISDALWPLDLGSWTFSIHKVHLWWWTPRFSLAHPRELQLKLPLKQHYRICSLNGWDLTGVLCLNKQSNIYLSRPESTLVEFNICSLAQTD